MIRDRRIWQPDKTCLGFMLDYRSDNPGAGSFRLGIFRVPRGHVAVIRSFLTTSIDAVLFTSDGAIARENSVVVICRGTSLGPCIQLSGACRVEYLTASGTLDREGFAANPSSIGHAPCCVVIEAGEYSVWFNTNNNRGCGAQFSGYTFPLGESPL